MESSNCAICLKPKPTLTCGVCKDALCKSCAQFLEAGSLSFLSKIPEECAHGAYCTPCFDARIVPVIEAYEETMEAAKRIAVFLKNQSKETRNFKRKEKPLKVTGCDDRDETLLRLAFMAAQANFNALVDVELTYEKVKQGSYQSHIWSGTGIPTNVTGRYL